ncbi:short-chain dehydrogenase [Nocardioides gansuensis]|uniref:Short-chain dehydrogenase n=1 Tax=Nocardioides gansuensis TaxID=2138300 RepID=A0A2T8FDL2_9ACTN|nr:SDR family NAD(P)-dependent oxidoreductase [Nocardioides gansuensis]PVG83801.1 short-chain dehydrogenase [Nocardioides gansuensis]
MANPQFALPGKTILITGATGGIGAACARALVKAGANVTLVDLNPAHLEALSNELGPDQSLAIAGDVTDRASMDDAVARTLTRFGALDVTFANAGIAATTPTTIRATKEEEFERIIEVDLLGVWRTVRASLPAISESNGHVLVTASIYAYFNGMLNAPYAMSKAGVEMFGRALRSELAGTGATAGVLYPGWVATPIIEASFGNPVTEEIIRLAYPKGLRQPVAPARIAQAVVKGLESRSPRITCPRRWVPISAARGALNVLTDAAIDRNARIHGLVRELDK